ncbi:hypothetical protein A2721_02815 [Candidatus Gottesmanbacteria bacterium RIFCSPHIGHO2_01_FULL_47_48]|uniref:Uncharacterized protein n=1 Tax=Candidatus Gottesmanbacteria bacterium RIFCSPHIGHO2_01_FULL_47_48 TaxID=1798381 RepID=A0A1F6A422_9BACT|nr:MAG: hypothetical protein A2721_02815 [Candidatus Gottesmanbacteria bacterium RIFCSPHIGHO2_01_FULL_47_48]
MDFSEKSLTSLSEKRANAFLGRANRLSLRLEGFSYYVHTDLEDRDPSKNGLPESLRTPQMQEFLTRQSEETDREIAAW